MYDNQVHTVYAVHVTEAYGYVGEEHLNRPENTWFLLASNVGYKGFFWIKKEECEPVTDGFFVQDYVESKRIIEGYD